MGETLGFTSLPIKKNSSYLFEFQINSDMIRDKNQTEDLLLSIIKNCETLIEQAHGKA